MRRHSMCFAACAALLISACTFAACGGRGETDNTGGSNLGGGNQGQVVTKSKLEKADDAVNAKYGSSPCYSIAGDKSYISVDTNPMNIDDFFYKEYADILKYVNETLGLPEYIYQEMLSTTSLQGKQTETVNGIRVSWTYHPDNGLEAIYILSE